MLQQVERSFTKAERRLLTRRADARASRKGACELDEHRLLLWTIGIAVTIAGTCVALGQRILAGVAPSIWLAVRCGAFADRRRLTRIRESNRKFYSEILARGRARAFICKPVRVFEREEFEDEGATWIFDGGDGRYLALQGQDHYGTPRFPSAEFEVVTDDLHSKRLPMPNWTN